MMQDSTPKKVSKINFMPQEDGAVKSRSRRVFLSWILALVFWLGLLGLFLLLPGPPKTANLPLPSHSLKEPEAEKSLYMSFQEDELENGPSVIPEKVKKEPLKPKLKEPPKVSEKAAENNKAKTVSPENTAPKADSASQNQNNLPLSIYIRELVRKIEASKHYPLSARLQNQEGKIKLRFKLAVSGELMGEPQILAASPYEALNQAALKAVAASAPFGAFPAGVSGPQDFILELQFTLKD